MKQPKARGIINFPGDPLDGTPVTVLGWSGSYPWVRTDDGKTFVWDPENLRPIVAEQMTMFEGSQP